ncbi:MAG: ATP-binding cassette domain-containing protein [Pseudomonadota bacterium]
MTALLEIEHLTVRHGEIVALADVSLTVGAGEAVALLGANGAGKSSLMQAVMGLARRVDGDIRLDGVALRGQPVHRRVARGIGYCPRRPTRVRRHDGAR